MTTNSQKTSNFADLKQPIQIAVFASGSGSNAQELVEHFALHKSARVSLIVCNRKLAGVLERAKKLDIPSLVITKEQLCDDSTLEVLKQKGINLIVLAGFLLKIPESLIQAFSNRIINIHPSLLPAHGGKGMYGRHVHEAVLANREKESGITIHLVNEDYDKGPILAQHKCSVLAEDDIASLQARVHALEHAYFSKCVEDYINKKWD